MERVAVAMVETKAREPWGRTGLGVLFTSSVMASEMRSPARGTSGRRAHLSSVQMSFGWTTESWEQNHEGPHKRQ